jgi:hypothetical protein
MKRILQIAVFLTLFLTLFFIVNIMPHPVTIVRNRIKTLRSNLFEELYVSRSIQERARWILELEQRRDEIRAELKTKLLFSRSQEKKIDSIINKAWDELLYVLKSGNAIQILAATEPMIIQGPSTAPSASMTAGLEEVEALEEIDEVEELDEVGEVEALDEAEALDNVEVLDDVESLDEAEELDEVEVLDEVETLDEVEALDEVETLEEAVSLDEARTAAKLEELFRETGEEIEKYDVVDKTEGVEVIEKIGDMQVISPFTTAPRVTVPKETVVPSSKGLLWLASKFRKSKETEKPPRPARGLLKLASSIFARLKETQKTEQDFIITDASPAPDPRPVRGLFIKASEIKARARGGRGLFKRASEIKAKTARDRGLLKRASKYYKPAEEAPITHKGFMALAREIEFNRDYPVTDDDPQQDFIADMHVVSPFASMFTNLK